MKRTMRRLGPFSFLAQFSVKQRRQMHKSLSWGYRVNGTCWEWTGTKKAGYGFYHGQLVHRLAYSLFVEDFRKADFICHRCNNPACYNPDHLYAGDAKTNAQDRERRYQEAKQWP